MLNASNVFIMKPTSVTEAIEVFHLLMLDGLGRKLDKNRLILKGGCNLRFFMKSFRYSEDMDLDVCSIPRDKLADAVEALLRSRTLADLTRHYGLSIERWSAPKQTSADSYWM